MKTKQLLQYILITLLINFKTYGQELIKVEIIELDINKSTIPFNNFFVFVTKIIFPRR